MGGGIIPDVLKYDNFGLRHGAFGGRIVKRRAAPEAVERRQASRCSTWKGEVDDTLSAGRRPARSATRGWPPWRGEQRTPMMVPPCLYPPRVLAYRSVRTRTDPSGIVRYQTFSVITDSTG